MKAGRCGRPSAAVPLGRIAGFSCLSTMVFDLSQGSTAPEREASENGEINEVYGD
jgi:hypothetical protein